MGVANKDVPKGRFIFAAHRSWHSIIWPLTLRFVRVTQPFLKFYR